MLTTGSIASGTFETSFEPCPSEPGPLAVIGRQLVAKRFEGDLVGTSTVEMLSHLTVVEGSGGYVALEVVSGVLWGRRGGFVVAHLGLMDGGQQLLDLRIVPRSGTGELSDLAGTMRIDLVDGVHRYELTVA